MTDKFLKELESPQLPCVSISHPGKVRQNNEDRLAVRNYVAAGQPARQIFLAVLSDGVGGNRAGEVAAQIGVETIVDLIGHLGSLDEPQDMLKEIVIAANLAVLKAASGKSEYEGMGATCICALLVEKRLYLANLGDSRAYLLRGLALRQLNFDHTWLEEEMQKADVHVQKHFVRSYPLAHVLSRYLGSPHPARVDMRIRVGSKTFQKEPAALDWLDLRSGDQIILCSDGLSDMLTKREIKAEIKGKNLEKDADRLLQKALKKGGIDNISVILFKIP